jgi:hypothetical protein
VEASEGCVEDCTGSKISFVVSSGGAASDQGGGGGGPAGVCGGTSFSGGLAGGSGWSGEGVVVGGAGGAAGEPSGSTGSTGCNGEGVGEKEVSIVREGIEALSIAVEGDGEVAGNGAGRQWEMGDNCSSSSSSESLSRSSSALHRRLAAFRVRLAGGEAIVAGEGTSGRVGDDWDDAVWRGAP